jgi:hypothetical protein
MIHHNALSGLNPEYSKRAVNCSRTDNHVKMRRFSDVSGTDSIPIFRVLLMAWQNQN